MHPQLRCVKKKCVLLAIVFGFALVLNNQFEILRVMYTTYSSGYSLSVRIEHNRTLTHRAEDAYERNMKTQDTLVLQNIRKLIQYPANQYDRHNMSRKELEDTSRGQAEIIDRSLGTMERGHFVEIGTGDGESGSPTIMLERVRSWTGLLIEPNPVVYQILINNRRHTKLLNACIKTRSGDWGIQSEQTRSGDWGIQSDQNFSISNVTCFWMDSILRAVVNYTIDLLSIAVEGKETDILEAFPFNEVKVTMVTIEFKGASARTVDIVELLKDRGLEVIHVLRNHPLDRTDLIFANKNGPVL